MSQQKNIDEAVRLLQEVFDTLDASDKKEWPIHEVWTAIDLLQQRDEPADTGGAGGCTGCTHASEPRDFWPCRDCRRGKERRQDCYTPAEGVNQ